jgi:thymidine kinase
MNWNHGTLEVISGPMKSAKTLELIFRLKKLDYSSVNYQLFKPEIDDRYSKEEVASRDGPTLASTLVPVDKPKEILFKLKPNIDVVAIDEGNFFSVELVEVIKTLLKDGKTVIVSGLDLDFRGEPFGVMPTLLSMADKVIKKHAYCDYPGCGKIANRTQRIVNGEPAKYDGPLIVVGGNELYEARCIRHHKVPKD